MPLFCSTDDFRSYVGDESAELTGRQLRSASLVIWRATRFAVMEVDSSGLPVDAGLRAALRDAACEVLAHRDDEGVLSPRSKELRGLKSATIGTATYTIDSGRGDGTVYDLPDDAGMILDQAGLLGGPVIVVG